MIHRERMEYPDYVYPVDEWRIVEKRFYPKYLAQTESYFATANGYLGMRGNFEEGAPFYQHGTFVNGFYESWPIVYGEKAYGFAEMGQTMVDVPDGKIIRLYVDDEPLFLPTADLKHYERVLDMRSGMLEREILWETPAGKQVSIKSKRLVSFQHRHLAAMAYEVTVLNGGAPVVISSELVNHEEDSVEDDDPRKSRSFDGRVFVPDVHRTQDYRVILGMTTKSSRMGLGCGMDHVLETECPVTVKNTCSEDAGKVVYCIEAKPGVPIRLFKFVSYHTSRRPLTAGLCDRAERTLDRTVEQGFKALADGQRAYMDDFWSRSDIKVEGVSKLQQAIRFNLFHLNQASGRAEGVGLPAKGLTGEGYEGHYFWDAEVYILPFLIYTKPRTARNLLHFRYTMLDKARKRARQVNQRGALFPWRTINGKEASAYYAAGTAQYHINADIMYTLRKYVEVTGDEEFLHDYGAEMLVETARLWADIGFYSDRRDGRFCIHGVTGPDEYNTVVDNNTFTNLMARENLWYASKVVQKIKEEKPDVYRRLADRTGLEEAEPAEWKKAADRMYLPFDERMRIHPQDDSFLDKEPWDFANTPEEKYPLLLHYHPLVIYRHQVIKQADVVLAMFLLGDEFTSEEKKRNFDYYDELTTGDSSLSVSIQSILAFELNYRDKAAEYLNFSLHMDLADIGGNAKDGLHMASMGGTWMAIVYGFAGMRDYEGLISFQPRIPKRVKRGIMPITVRGRRLVLEVDQEKVTYTLKEGEAITIHHGEEEIRLSPAAPTVIRRHDKTERP